MSGWDFGGRRRSNTAQKLEQIRKERQKRIKVKTVKWEEPEENITKEDLVELFEKKTIIQNSKTETAVNESCVKNWEDLVVTSTKSSCKSETSAGNHKGDGVNCLKDENQMADKVQFKKVIKNESLLSKNLKALNPDNENPFRGYSRFNGRGHGNPTQCFTMFVYPHSSTTPVGPLQVVILQQNARVLDLIGLTCWQYQHEKFAPKLQQTNIVNYTVKLAEEDGEVDQEFPSLQVYEPVRKFHLPTLALIEKKSFCASGGSGGNAESETIKSLFVKVNHCDGTSLIQVQDLSVSMDEIMRKALLKRKRKPYAGKYKLEYQDREGVAVKGEQSLDSTNAMEFYLLREHCSRVRSYDSPEFQTLSEVADFIECSTDLIQSGFIMK